MATMEDLPMLRLPVPPGLPTKGRWIDNGPLSNMNPGSAVVRFRSVASHYVEPAYVAAKAPDAPVRSPHGGTRPFHEAVAAADPRRAKRLGVPRSRGGLIDPRPDLEEVCIGAMASMVAQKFVAGTPEAAWLATREPILLVEWTNWNDRRWGVSMEPGGTHAYGRNALGLLLVVGQERLVEGRPLPAAPEEEWGALQRALVPAMARRSRMLFGR